MPLIKKEVMCVNTFNMIISKGMEEFSQVIAVTSAAAAFHWQGSQACECLCCSLRIWPGPSMKPAALRSLEGSNSHHSKWPPSPRKKQMEQETTVRYRNSILVVPKE